MADRYNRVGKREYDGVIYTPGTASERGAQASRTSGRGRNGSASSSLSKAPTRKAGIKRRKKPHKSQVGVFLAATLFIGVMACVIIFALVFAPLINGTDSAVSSEVPEQAGISIDTPPAEATALSEKTQSMTGLVKSIGTDGRINVYDFTTGKSLNLVADNLSQLNDKYGAPILFAEISAGDIVDVEYIGNLIRELFFSRQATEYKDKTNVKVDMTERKIEIGNEVFSFNDHLVIGGDFNLASLKPIDMVTVKFYKNVIWYIELTRGHGFLEFENIDIVMDGIVEVDNNIIKSLDEFDRLELSSGSHHLVVKGANVQPLSQEIYIERDETKKIDLSELTILLGQLILKVNERDYTVYIDDEEIDLKLPIELPYGSYPVVVEKQGFSPWEGTVEIIGRTNQLEVELLERVQFCQFSVTSTPTGAEIYIDNAFIGITPCTVPIEYGEHTLTYKKEGYKSVSFPLTLNTPTLSKPYEIMLQEDTPFMPDGY